MNTKEPIAVMEQWIRDSHGAFSLPITLALGLKANDDSEAVAAILNWISQPRDPIPMRSAEISLRAFIDFECSIGTSEGYQEMIDNELLSAADAGVVPVNARVAINTALGDRPQQKQRAFEAAASWQTVRPTNQAIYEWCTHRFEMKIKELMQNPNQ